MALKTQKRRVILTFPLTFVFFPSSLSPLLDARPRDKPPPPEQVSSYQVAPTFCNKSIPSNPKLQLNFLNAELVKPGIRRRVRGGEKVLSLQPAGLGAGICGDVVGAY